MRIKVSYIFPGNLPAFFQTETFPKESLTKGSSGILSSRFPVQHNLSKGKLDQRLLRHPVLKIPGTA
jgi:hypothetical protein